MKMAYLPSEVWLEVVGYLKDPTTTCESDKFGDYNDHESSTQQMLADLCLVSRQLRVIAQPMLYCVFVKQESPAAKDRLLKRDSPWLHKYFQRDQRSLSAIRKETRLENFLRTLILRPDLAAEVRRVRLDRYNEFNLLPYQFRLLYHKRPLPQVTSDTFVGALKDFKGFDRLNSRFRKSWENCLQDGEEGAEIALLLTLVPGLLSLYTEPWIDSLGFILGTICEVMLRSKPPQPHVIRTARGALQREPVEQQSRTQQPTRILPFLTALSVRSPGMWTVPLQYCVDLLSLPTLLSFTGEFLCGYFPEYPHRDMGPLSNTSLNHLRHLHLDRCKLNGPCLQALLGTCTALRSLKIDSSFAFNFAVEILPSINFQFLEALQNMAGTLECLTLMLPEYDNTVYLDLRTLGNLRYLETDMYLLTHDDGPPYVHELLPPSIETLIIRRAEPEILPHLDKLLDTYQPIPELSRLSVMKLYVLEDSDNDLEKELVPVQNRAQEHNLNFGFEKEPDESHWWWWWYNPEPEFESDSSLSDGDDTDVDN